MRKIEKTDPKFTTPNINDMFSRTEDIDRMFSRIGKTNHRLETLEITNSIGKNTNTKLEYLKDFTNLTDLGLFYLNIMDQGLFYVKYITSLTKLSLSGNFNIKPSLSDNSSTQDSGLFFVKDLTNLIELNLSSNRRLADEELSCVQYLTNLIKLNLSATNIRNQGLFYVKHLTNLTELNLSSNDQFTDKELFYVKYLIRLKELNLSRNQNMGTSGKLGYFLEDLTNLEKLDLSRIPALTDPCLENLPTSITELDVANGKHHMNFIPLTRLTNLKILRIADSHYDKIKLIPLRKEVKIVDRIEHWNHGF